MAAKYDDTEIGGHQVRFTSTHWTLLEKVRGSLTPAHQEALELLTRQYWKPVYYFIRQQRRQYDNEKAKDLTQDFFMHCLVKELFGRADRTKGRFRNFLLKSLKNFLNNVEREQRAQKRRPPGGKVFSIDSIIGDEDIGLEPRDDETPEATFNRHFFVELVRQISDLLRRKFLAEDQQVHYEIFQLRVIEPFLERTEPPTINELAKKFGITDKQVSNLTITARRAFQRLLREYIRCSACSEEDVTAEVQDLFDFISQS